MVPCRYSRIILAVRLVHMVSKETNRIIGDVYYCDAIANAINHE